MGTKKQDLEFVRFKIKLAKLSDTVRRSRSGVFNDEVQKNMGNLCAEFFQNIDEECEFANMKLSNNLGGSV